MKKTIAFHDEYFRNENFYFFVLIDKIKVFLFSYPFSLSLLNRLTSGIRNKVGEKLKDCRSVRVRRVSLFMDCFVEQYKL